MTSTGAMWIMLAQNTPSMGPVGQVGSVTSRTIGASTLGRPSVHARILSSLDRSDSDG